MMKIKLNYFINESINSIVNNGLMSIISVITITISMFTFSFFLSGMMNLNFIANSLESQVEVSVFLAEDTLAEDREILENEMKKMENIQSFRYIPKKDALENLKENLELHTIAGTNAKNEDDLNMWDKDLEIKNPLPDAYLVSVKNPRLLEDTAKALENYQIVESVSFGENIIEKVFNLTEFLHALTLFLIVMLFIATIFIISNTMTISVHARKTEIEVMRYIGATNSMIYFPFLFEGAFLGTLGGLSASIVFRIVYSIFVSKFYDVVSFIQLIPAFPFLTYMSIILILLGILIGAIGSVVSVKRYLQV